MSWLPRGNIETKLPAPLRSSGPDASSLNMENKGAPRLATMLWKCLFPCEDIMPVVTEVNFQLKTLQWLLTHLHYFLKTTCTFFGNRTY